ncbi:sigma-70 family RNA polymerase sigma factor [Paenibacillus rhizovicinus]|uniref:Sigma-70 family RNA polymerase sigma factor n=1 Tax=Paenibacillus rhizovicinus TaxID=2704463 RepID=A0A6C0NZ27_9BACL|nr:sigma-70 family RNA polymerase sigma factor [Paenibacillus rhizovicinus]QHW31477.1 sigma-70 family RNA polymerase sigma factor [Paenibacillus rhizovicinus]
MRKPFGPLWRLIVIKAGREVLNLDTTKKTANAETGNGDAFLLLMDGSKERLYRIALAYLHREADALEALQEATFRAYKSFRKLKEPSYFHTWIVRILLNVCADEFRGRKRKGKDIRFSTEIEGTAGAFADASDTRISLRELVDGLPREQKEIIILKYYQQLTLTEVSAILECPLGTVKTRLHKALVALRGELGEEGSHDFARA